MNNVLILHLKNFPRLVEYARRRRSAAAASGAATSLAFIFPLGDDVTRKFDILEISRLHDAATMPQMRIRFRPSDAFLPSMRGATVRGK